MPLRLACLLLLLPLVLSSAQAAETERKAGTVFKDCDACPEMVVIPPGEFVMGSVPKAKGEPNEQPRVNVKISKPFALSKTEITFDQWALCAKDGACRAEPDDHTWGRGNRPVINMTWAEAVTYTEWLSKVSGARYRLPSEGEWEYAARAGTTTEFWWGDLETAPGGPHAQCYTCQTNFGRRSAPVGSFKPNPFGLHDMNGNVWEWTLDCWQPDHKGADPEGKPRPETRPGTCKSERTVRGGSWYFIGFRSRSASRAKGEAELTSYDIGIRVLRELP